MSDDQMDSSAARDHLQMVDRILAQADDTARLSGAPFIVWGIAGGALNVVVQLVNVEQRSPNLLWISASLLVLATAFMIWFGINEKKQERRGLLDRHIGNLFMIAWIVALISMSFGSHIFPAWAQAAIWSLMFGAAMLNAALLARSPIAFAGGAILIASILVANMSLPYAGYILAAGDFIGMAGAGLALTIARR
ncbi:MAG: hypothetical protein M3N19_11805 [Candidatus Eremiobacteraeota bacterium]|nr:hypothetical protein [Candidatus Eremiobacteraeota bacterium]